MESASPLSNTSRIRYIGPADNIHHPQRGVWLHALTKQDIADRIVEQFDFSKNQSVEITKSLLERIKTSLGSGDDVLVSGFGKFCVKEKAKREVRNTATGEDLILPARRVVRFKCSNKLSDKVNGK